MKVVGSLQLVLSSIVAFVIIASLFFALSATIRRFLKNRRDKKRMKEQNGEEKEKQNSSSQVIQVNVQTDTGP